MVTETNNSNLGFISAVNGSLVEVKGLENQVRLHDLIKISNYNIICQVIQIYSDHVIAQSFESTNSIKLNDKAINLNEPLSMELAPGLLANVFDGIQRPLDLTFSHFKEGRLRRGLEFPSLSRTKKWHFIPSRKINGSLSTGDEIGTVQETSFFKHKIMIPPENSGILSFIVDEGDYTIIDEIYTLRKENVDKSFSMLQKWPVTMSKPYSEKNQPSEPLLTGLRIVDLLFPVAKGGTFAVPGGFGTGKTIISQHIAKFCNADVVLYIGCGEPGNEIANFLKQFAETIDPKTGRPLLEHIVLIANTSNMPVSAREASLFSGITIAEYYRDMGYDVAVVADSISRWAESLREISGLLEEMPAEEGYPAYLPSKLSSFFERAGVITTLGCDAYGRKKKGSITIIGSISPPAGDFSEPVTAATKRVVQGIWALDPKLAYLKHYPAISWISSYSNYPEYVAEWWRERDIVWPEINLNWFECRKQVNEILAKENELKYLIQLLGLKNLAEDQRLEIFTANLIRNAILIQNAFNVVDSYTSSRKLLGLVKVILLLYNKSRSLVKRGFLIDEKKCDEVLIEVMKISHYVPNENFEQIEELRDKINNESLGLVFNVHRR
ncbi:MAG: V-type ATP synthase subunit A [Promethearchaeota archaeon Loki_b31]|nr:MAG: V-type ATP synthase subunit A [Candidatus Lokiarchaeota archaeon Loki_b31]